MTKKLPFRVKHYGGRIEVSGDFTRNSVLRSRRFMKSCYQPSYIAELSWSSEAWLWGWQMVQHGWAWRDLTMRAKGRNWQSDSSKKEKKFWRKVNRRIERHFGVEKS